MLSVVVANIFAAYLQFFRESGSDYLVSCANGIALVRRRYMPSVAFPVILEAFMPCDDPD